MPTYEIVCANCGNQDLVAPMREAASLMPCPICHRPRPQVFHPPQFTEDRTRFWKGPMGNGYSTALGERMPDSRSARDRRAKEKGIEFCSLAELRADNKEAAEAIDYHAQVQAGGPREDPRTPAAPVWREKPSWAEGVT